MNRVVFQSALLRGFVADRARSEWQRWQTGSDQPDLWIRDRGIAVLDVVARWASLEKSRRLSLSIDQDHLDQPVAGALSN